MPGKVLLVNIVLNQSTDLDSLLVQISSDGGIYGEFVLSFRYPSCEVFAESEPFLFGLMCSDFSRWDHNAWILFREFGTNDPVEISKAVRKNTSGPSDYLFWCLNLAYCNCDGVQ